MSDLAPVWPGRMNVWSLLWAGPSEMPSDDKVRSAIATEFSAWFGGVAGPLLDPVLTYYSSTRSGDADLIRVEQWGLASAAPASSPVTVSDLTLQQKSAGAVVRREQLAVIPMLPTGATVYRVRVRFAWRGTQQTVQWPLASAGWFSSGYEWMLDVVHPPEAFAPEELSAWEKLTGQVADAAGSAVLDATQPVADATESVTAAAVEAVKSPWVMAAAIGAGAAVGLYVIQTVRSWRR